MVATELVSVDGVMESPEEWAFSYSHDERRRRTHRRRDYRKALKVADSKTFGTCVVSLTYLPTGE
jgi:hypothetical protein